MHIKRVGVCFFVANQHCWFLFFLHNSHILVNGMYDDNVFSCEAHCLHYGSFHFTYRFYEYNWMWLGKFGKEKNEMKEQRPMLLWNHFPLILLKWACLIFMNLRPCYFHKGLHGTGSHIIELGLVFRVLILTLKKIAKNSERKKRERAQKASQLKREIDWNAYLRMLHILSQLMLKIAHLWLRFHCTLSHALELSIR